MAETLVKVLNAEIDVRSYFTSFDFPKLPEVIQAIEHVFNTDVTKVVKALRGPLMGLYRIQARDYTLYRGKDITLRGIKVPVILRTEQPKTAREGILVTIYDSYTPKFQSLNGKDFDKHFMDIAGVAMIKQTTPQFYKGTRVLNGNRYFVANFNVDDVELGESVNIGGAQFNIQYTGIKKFCYLCNERHGTVCKAKLAFDRMRQQRAGKLTHKIYTDSSLRNANQLALAANVACTSGGGIGQVVNAATVDPEVQENVVIFAGANEVKHAADNHEYTYTVQKAAEKMHSLTKNKKVTLLLPTVPLETLEEKARYELLKETMGAVKTINMIEIKHPIEYADGHPSMDGTKAIIGRLEAILEEQLILEPDHVVTERKYSQVQALYKMGCRACDSMTYTRALCVKCLDEAKKVDITRFETLLADITSSEFPPADDDVNMNDPNKRGNTDDDNKVNEKNPKRPNLNGNANDQKFTSKLKPQSTRHILFNKLLQCQPSYLKHYLELNEKYNNKNEIHFEYLCKLKDNIRRLAAEDNHYKFKMYLDMNNNLVPSKFINDCRAISSKITKFRVGSHCLPIETGRWCRTPRDERLCKSCKVLGDELHLIYRCSEINRNGLIIPDTLSNLWECDDVMELFQRIDASTDYI